MQSWVFHLCIDQLLHMTTDLHDDDWTDVVGNLRKSRKSWEYLARILGQEGANPRVLGMFFRAVVQAMVLFGS